MKLNRRDFLKLGAASSALLYLESKFSLLTSLGKELKQSGKSISLKGRQRKSVSTTCLMCGVTDGINCYVENGRVAKIEGNPKHPNTRGRICAKGQSGIQFLYDPYRIKYPMLRIGERGEDKWKRISRDQALNIVADKIKEAQRKGEPGRIAHHKGRDRDATIVKRFTKAIGTAHTFNHTSICESSMKVGYETTWGTDFSVPDVPRTKYGILFGDNIFEASYMMVPMAQRYMEAKINGMKLVVFDPRLSNTAALADEWHALRPGTDGAVLLAMANVISKKNYKALPKVKQFFKEWANYPYEKLVRHLSKFTPKWAEDISGVPAADIERLANELADSAPQSFVRNYNGLSNNVNGAMNARILAVLNALLGNIDEEGGLSTTIGGSVKEPEPKPAEPEGEFPLYEMDHEKYPLASHHAWHLLPNYVDEVRYKLDLYMIHMYNPLFSNPDVKKWRQFLYDKEKVGFIVDFSPFWSETATEVADLIIPDVTYLERLAVSTMPSLEQMPFVQLYQPAVDSLYESSDLYENYFEIAKRVGGETAKYFNFKSVEDYQKRVVEGEWGEGSWEKLKKDGVLIPTIEGKSYKSFDQLTDDELKGLRKYLGYSKEIKPEKLAEMREKKYQFPSGDGPILDEKGKKTKGLVKKGKFYNGFATETGLITIYSEKWKKEGFPALPDYMPIPHFAKKKADDMYLITGKWNVHTQSRTANIPWLLELVSYNPAWMNPLAAKKRGIKDGDEIIISSGIGAKKMKCRVRLIEGINPECIYVSNTFGHWRYGDLASKGILKEDNGQRRPMFDEQKDFPSDNLEAGYNRTTTSQARVFPFKINQASPVNEKGFSNKKNVDPISKDWEGKTVLGYHVASIMEASKKYTDSVGGEYAWSNVLVKVKKA